MYEKSEELVKKLFSGKLDKGGYPYLDHLYEVSNKDNKEEVENMVLALGYYL